MSIQSSRRYLFSIEAVLISFSGSALSVSVAIVLRKMEIPVKMMSPPKIKAMRLSMRVIPVIFTRMRPATSPMVE